MSRMVRSLAVFTGDPLLDGCLLTLESAPSSLSPIQIKKLLRVHPGIDHNLSRVMPKGELMLAG